MSAVFPSCGARRGTDGYSPLFFHAGTGGGVCRTGLVHELRRQRNLPEGGALQDAARRTPAHLLLLETDAPYLTPEPLRGRPNSPANVVHTYDFVARLRGVSTADLAELVLANAAQAFPRLNVPARG